MAVAQAQDSVRTLPPLFGDETDTFDAERDTLATIKRSFTTSGKISGHAYVDLGLSVKWALCNIGAAGASDCGDYYAWGETKKKKVYNPDNSTTYEWDIASIGGDRVFDVAKVLWGASWRLPTKAEAEELIRECKWTWTCDSKNYGYLITGLNGNTIFLPMAGRCYDTTKAMEKEVGCYWTSDSHEIDNRKAYILCINGGDMFLNWYNRFFGCTVRPVSD